MKYISTDVSQVDSVGREILRVAEKDFGLFVTADRGGAQQAAVGLLATQARHVIVNVEQKQLQQKMFTCVGSIFDHDFDNFKQKVVKTNPDF